MVQETVVKDVVQGGKIKSSDPTLCFKLLKFLINSN